MNETRTRVMSSTWGAWRWPVLLFGLTVLTTLFAGASHAGATVDWGALLSRPLRIFEHLARGVPFAASMLAILAAHEFGHYSFARRHGIDATPPHFIPFPTLLGTLGAVIRIRGTLPTRTTLVDVGVSGPLAGLAVALPLLWLGLSWSHFAPLPPWPAPPQTLAEIFAAFRADAPVSTLTAGLLLPGESLLFGGLRHLVLGPVPEGFYVQLHPVAWAAAFGLFVTALNLLPVGQLDGGHALYALLSPAAARWCGRLVVFALMLLGLFAWPGWLLWALLAGKLIGTSHPPVTEAVRLSRGRTLAALVALLMLPLTFAPMPVFVR